VGLNVGYGIIMLSLYNSSDDNYGSIFFLVTLQVLIDLFLPSILNTTII